MMSTDPSPMHVLFLVPRLDKASTRYRVSQFLPALERAGMTWEIRTLSCAARDWPRLLPQARRADLVFIQKKLFSPLEIALLRRFCQRLIYDLDDAVMFKDGPASARQHARQNRRFAATARRADLVIAGNRYLAEKVRSYQSRVVEIPTSLDLSRYVPKDQSTQASKEVVLGWIGSRGTLQYLCEIAPSLEALGRQIPGLRLKIVADDFFDLQYLQVEKKRWRLEDEIADLHSFNIGLMPLSDNVWTQGKCGFKLLQCMAVGIPVVCSPVAVNREIVTDGVEGFWAQSEVDWIVKIREIIQNPELGLVMGRNGREKVEKKYSLNVTAPYFIDVLKNIKCNERL